MSPFKSHDQVSEYLKSNSDLGSHKKKKKRETPIGPKKHHICVHTALKKIIIIIIIIFTFGYKEINNVFESIHPANVNIAIEKRVR